MLLVAGMLLCGCTAFGVATRSGYDAVLKTWVGDSTRDLVARWGKPDARYLSGDGGTVLQYARTSGTSADLQIGQPQFGTHVTEGAANPSTEFFEAAKRQQEYMSVDVVHRCITRFIADRNGVIQRWQYLGDSCRAVAPRGGARGTARWDTEALPLVSPRVLGTLIQPRQVLRQARSMVSPSVHPRRPTAS
ncbi:MAG: hypothetical protein ACRD1F_11635 [Terriglobales bacterium]